MKKKNCAIFEIVCYVVAALLAVAALYMTYENIAYINEYAAAYGATFADLGSQAVQSVLSAFVPYFTYAFVVFGIGRIYHQVAAPKCTACQPEEQETVVIDGEPVEAIAEPVIAEEAEAEDAAEEVIEVVDAEVVDICEAEEGKEEAK